MARKPKTDEVISLSDAASHYGFSGDYFRRLAENGRLAARKIGRLWFTTLEEVGTFLESREPRGVYKKDVKQAPTGRPRPKKR